MMLLSLFIERFGLAAQILVAAVTARIVLNRVVARRRVLKRIYRVNAIIGAFEERLAKIDKISHRYFLSLGKNGSDTLYDVRSCMQKLWRVLNQARELIDENTALSLLAARELLDEIEPSLSNEASGPRDNDQGESRKREDWQQYLEERLQEIGLRLFEAAENMHELAPGLYAEFHSTMEVLASAGIQSYAIRTEVAAAVDSPESVPELGSGRGEKVANMA